MKLQADPTSSYGYYQDYGKKIGRAVLDDKNLYNTYQVKGLPPGPICYPSKGAIDAALECKQKGESKTILFNLCGHGYFDMSAYDDYLNGNMADDIIDEDGISKSISQIPEVA